MCECVCVCVSAYVCVHACAQERQVRKRYFTPTKSVSDLYSMHEEEYCNIHYTNSSWRKEREGQSGRGADGERWKGQMGRGGRGRGAEGEGWEGQKERGGRGSMGQRGRGGRGREGGMGGAKGEG